MSLVLLLQIGFLADEVIVPAYTYTATASVTQHVGCKVVMVDSQKDNVEMDYDKLAEAITERTKVICPVDLGGVVCDYDKVYAVVEAKKHLFRPANEIQKKIGRVIVAADDAHAFGASWHGKKAGSIADFSSFSFHAVKNLTMAEGGALTWSLPFGEQSFTAEELKNYFPTVPYMEGETWNELLYRLSQLMSLHGQNKDALAKTKLGAWEYDVIGPWYKCNMTDVLAALGLKQLDRYPEMLQRRKQIIERYDTACDGLGIRHLVHSTAYEESSNHLYLIRIPGIDADQRNNWIEFLAQHGVATNVHYKPLPMMSAYKELGWDIADFPNSYDYYKNLITLPLYSTLSDEDVDYVCIMLRETAKKMQA